MDRLCFVLIDLIDEISYYQYYIDNIKTTGHQALFIGIQELNENEKCSKDSLPQIIDQLYRFSSNYFVRIYISGCYYLNQQGYWNESK
jgi:hypothetical protein